MFLLFFYFRRSVYVGAGVEQRDIKMKLLFLTAYIFTSFVCVCDVWFG